MANRIGQQLGNYRLIRLLGEGGFAEVYLGEHIHLGTQAAIKLLLEQLPNQDKQKFYDEARNIARLIHPHIVRLLEFGVQGSTPFMVMDYAPHGTLRDRHQTGEQLSLATIVSYIKQITDGLQYAHDEKFIHRDIKPANMLVGRRNEILLSDFGIAVIAHSTRSQKTEEVIGTWKYTAPEQFQGKPQPASDQYALGVVVYEWLSGFPPFQGSVAELYNQHLSVPPPSFLTKNPTLPPEVEQVVLKALAKDPHQRFANVQDFANALEQAYMVYNAPTIPVGAIPPQSPSTPAILTPAPPKVIKKVRIGTTHITYNGHADKSSQNGLETRVAWSPDGKRIASASYAIAASANYANTIQVWDAASGKRIVSYRAHQNVVYDLAWSPDGKYLASAGDDNTVHVRNVNTGDVEFVYGGHFASVLAVAWSPYGGRIVSGDLDGVAHVWDITTGYTVFKHLVEVKKAGEQNFVRTVAWSSDGNSFAFGSVNGRVSINRGNAFLSYLLPNLREIDTVALFSDGSRVVSGGRGFPHNICVLEVDTGRVVLDYDGHNDTVRASALSPDSKRVASGSHDQTVQIWNPVNGGDVFTYRGHSTKVTSLTWSPDGTSIASADASGTIQVWQAT